LAAGHSGNLTIADFGKNSHVRRSLKLRENIADKWDRIIHKQKLKLA
jgi:hypothetical protein